jgi:hypothetical protein
VERTAALEAPVDEWAEVESWSLRAQALAELRALSQRDAPHGPTRTIRIP